MGHLQWPRRVRRWWRFKGVRVKCTQQLRGRGGGVREPAPRFLGRLAPLTMRSASPAAKPMARLGLGSTTKKSVRRCSQPKNVASTSGRSRCVETSVMKMSSKRASEAMVECDDGTCVKHECMQPGRTSPLALRLT